MLNSLYTKNIIVIIFYYNIFFLFFLSICEFSFHFRVSFLPSIPRLLHAKPLVLDWK